MRGRVVCVTVIALSALLMQLRAQSNAYFFNVTVNDSMIICGIHEKYDSLLIGKNMTTKVIDSVLVTKPDTAYWQYTSKVDSIITVAYKQTRTYNFEGKIKYSYFDPRNRDCKVSIDSLTLDTFCVFSIDSIWGDTVTNAGVDKSLSFRATGNDKSFRQVFLHGTVGAENDTTIYYRADRNNGFNYYPAEFSNRDSIYQRLKGKWHRLTTCVDALRWPAYWVSPADTDKFQILEIANDSCYLEKDGKVVDACAFQLTATPYASITLRLPSFQLPDSPLHEIFVLNNDLIGTEESESMGTRYAFFFYREGAQLVYNQLAAYESYGKRPFSYAHLKVKSTAASPLISYYLPKSAFIHLSAFNTLGQRVAMLFEGQQSAGEHEVQMGQMNLSRGMYFIALEGAGPRIIYPLRIWK